MRLDTDFWYDEKIRKLKFNKNLGGHGICVYLYIITECYRENGSFVMADESFLFKIAEYFAITTGLVEEIILACANVGLLYAPLITNNARKKAGHRISGCLTSVTIQERYVIMWQKSKRAIKNLEIPAEICLISAERIQELLGARDIENDVSSEDRGLNSEFEEQRKEKEKKEKKILIDKSISFLAANASSYEEFLQRIDKDTLREQILWWLGYKDRCNQKFPAPSKCKGELTNLLKASGGDSARAEELIFKAIVNGWQGFRFPSANKTQLPNNQSYNNVGSKETKTGVGGSSKYSRTSFQ